jgi:hypothetical protein
MNVRLSNPTNLRRLIRRRIPTLQVPRNVFNEMKRMPATSITTRRLLEHLQPAGKK